MQGYQERDIRTLGHTDGIRLDLFGLYSKELPADRWNEVSLNEDMPPKLILGSVRKQQNDCKIVMSVMVLECKEFGER